MKIFGIQLPALSAALASAIVLGGAGFGINAHATAATGNATATVIAPIAIANTADLAFGKFAASTGGTVVMSPAGTRNATGAVALSTVLPGAAASFNVTTRRRGAHPVRAGLADQIAADHPYMKPMQIRSSPSGSGVVQLEFGLKGKAEPGIRALKPEAGRQGLQAGTGYCAGCWADDWAGAFHARRHAPLAADAASPEAPVDSQTLIHISNHALI